MRSLGSVMGSGLWYVLCLASLALVLGQLSVLIRAFRQERGRRALIPAALILLLGFGICVILMDCAQSRVYSAADRERVAAFQWALFALPWAGYAAAEALSAFLLLRQIREERRYRKSHLTLNAIRQSVDLLPEGLSVSEDDGTVLLSNLRMNELCRMLTGGSLADAGKLRHRVREIGEEQNGQYLVWTEDGGTWLFTEKPFAAEGRQVSQLTAADVTETVRVIEELRKKNDHLLDLQRRMRAVSELSADMFTAQEEAAARAALHNQLGQVLLMGRHCLEHPENADEDVVYMTTRQMNAFLLGEAEVPEGEKDDVLRQALYLAGSIGVTVGLKGPIRDDRTQQKLLSLAIRECAANTVKHAEGSRLEVKVREEGNRTVITLTNNGRPPKGEVEESGGLLTLRHRVEDAGGSMQIQSLPVFRLTMVLPKV